MKYAVYVIMVEDTAENDERIGNQYYESMDRIAGNLTSVEAEDVAARAHNDAREYDKGIAGRD